MRIAVTLLLLGSGLFAACSRSDRPVASTVAVVAAESPWGAIATAIGGRDVTVTSLLEAPGADPHEYQPTAAAAAAVAKAAVVIENGLGYDPFMERILAQGSTGPRRVIKASEVLKVVGPNANPHLWYAIDRVPKVAGAIESALSSADPRHAADFRRNLREFLRSLDGPRTQLASIRADHAGASVLVTERLADYLLAEAGLTVTSPPSFARSVESGESPSAAATAEMRRLLGSGSTAALILNAQVQTPSVRAVSELARTSGVPVVRMTETIQPPGVTYVAWQQRQITSLAAALGTSR
jgi:zinc/manganese transport system substrate-binding protein